MIDKFEKFVARSGRNLIKTLSPNLTGETGGNHNKNLSQDTRYPNRDSKRAPPEIRNKSSIARLTCSVKRTDSNALSLSYLIFIKSQNCDLFLSYIVKLIYLKI